MGEQKEKNETEAEAIERYRKLQAEGHHKLPYKEFLRAKELGIELPEADPVYRIGGGIRRLLSIPVPKGFPLERCYRVTEELRRVTYVGGDNADALAALGQLAEPFVPVWIEKGYDGYSWTKLPTVEGVVVDAKLGEKPLCSYFGCKGYLQCVESIVVTVYTSDGKEHSGNVCLAACDPEPSCQLGASTLTVCVTPEARTRLNPLVVLDFLYFGTDDLLKAAEHLVKLKDFWLLREPDEAKMWCTLTERLEVLLPDWTSITRSEEHRVTIKLEGLMPETIHLRPPSEIP